MLMAIWSETNRSICTPRVIYSRLLCTEGGLSPPPSPAGSRKVGTGALKSALLKIKPAMFFSVYYTSFIQLHIKWEGVDWMHLYQDRDQWRAHVKKLMSLQVP
jgi:hypothetical protein